MQISIKEALENERWHDFYNKDGNQGPYKFRLTSFNKIDLGFGVRLQINIYAAADVFLLSLA